MVSVALFDSKQGVVNVPFLSSPAFIVSLLSSVFGTSHGSFSDIFLFAGWDHTRVGTITTDMFNFGKPIYSRKLLREE
jgi:hypothetical protein